MKITDENRLPYAVLAKSPISFQGRLANTIR